MLRNLTLRISLVALALAIVGLVSSSASAQRDDDKKIEEVDLVAKDGVIIKANYYHGSDDKKTVPVILVHGEGDTRSDLDMLAKSLQKAGHAVLAPDLRGHGDSTSVQGAPNAKLDHTKMRPADFAASAFDIEACKKYFKDLNNAGKVNIENLTLIGTGPMGSVLSFAYSGEDWRVRPFGRFKQGQDVKAVIMFSPTLRDKTIQASGYMRDISVAQEMSFFLIVNDNSNAAARDAERFEDAIRRVDRVKDDDKRIVRLNVKTTLEGIKILEVQEADKILEQINTFIKVRVTDKNFEWQDRER